MDKRDRKKIVKELEEIRWWATNWQRYFKQSEEEQEVPIFSDDYDKQEEYPVEQPKIKRRIFTKIKEHPWITVIVLIVLWIAIKIIYQTQGVDFVNPVAKFIFS